MSRGIHLKQLTRAHLELLGLPEGGGPSVRDLAMAEEGETPPLPEQGQPCLAEGPVDSVATPPRRVAPPANPACTLAQDAEGDLDPDWQPLDLRALAREIRLELEVTLRLLDGPAGRAAMPD